MNALEIHLTMFFLPHWPGGAMMDVTSPQHDVTLAVHNRSPGLFLCELVKQSVDRETTDLRPSPRRCWKSVGGSFVGGSSDELH